MADQRGQSEKHKRKPGRPPRAATSKSGKPADVSLGRIMENAINLSRTEPLQDVSIVRLGKEFGVTPAAIHYYVGNRDTITSGVINHVFKELMDCEIPDSQDWRDQIMVVAQHQYDVLVRYSGVTTYLVGHNRFRLVQNSGPDETDYGVMFFNRVVAIFQSANFSAEHAALGWHLLVQHVLSSAHAEIGRQLPGDHRGYLEERLADALGGRYSAIAFVLPAFVKLDARSAFRAGIEILLDGFEQFRKLT